MIKETTLKIMTVEELEFLRDLAWKGSFDTPGYPRNTQGDYRRLSNLCDKLIKGVTSEERENNQPWKI